MIFSHILPPEYQPFAWASVDEIFMQADVISLHAFQTPDNVGFINRRLLKRMKKSAYLINTSRGGLINETDLTESLNQDWLAGAALDVVSKEPINKNSPLLSAKNIILTPHISWATTEARKRLMDTTIENIKAYLAGHNQNVVT